MKIMIVDDHMAIRQTLIQIVMESNSEAIEIIECESGEEAVAQYEINQPDWVLMDIELKQMDGFEAIEIIHSLDIHAKIIIVTSYYLPSFKTRAKEMKVHGFILKDRLLDVKKFFQV